MVLDEAADVLRDGLACDVAPSLNLFGDLPRDIVGPMPKHVEAITRTGALNSPEIRSAITVSKSRVRYRFRDKRCHGHRSYPLRDRPFQNRCEARSSVTNSCVSSLARTQQKRHAPQDRQQPAQPAQAAQPTMMPMQPPQPPMNPPPQRQPPQPRQPQPRQPQPPQRPQPQAAICRSGPGPALVSLSKRLNVARLTSAISSSPRTKR